MSAGGRVLNRGWPSLERVWAWALAWVLGAVSPALGADSSDSVLGRSASVLPPTPPLAENPVKRFRDLLALDAAGREAALGGRTEWQQRYLRERLAEFDALTATEREVRLGLMHLRYLMLTLLRTPEAHREERFREVPEEDRELLDERLREWEKLPADQQQELLQNEAVLSRLSWLEADSAERRAALLKSLSPQRREEFEAELQRWRDLPEAQRQRLTRNFSRFFELSERGKQKALERVAEADRGRIERAMLAFEQLPPEERSRCLDALNRYAAMSPEERARFLENLARWQNMSSDEKEAWRRVAARVVSGRTLAKRPPMPPPPSPRGGPAWNSAGGQRPQPAGEQAGPVF